MLVSVLMLGTLLISCATVFTWFVRMQVRGIWRENENLSRRTMANVIVNSVMTLLAGISERVKHDSPLQEWYRPFMMSEPDTGMWVIQVTPLDDKIPLRNLFLPDGNTMRREYTEVWREMWNNLEHHELELLTLDFMDKNNRPRVGSREEKYFINRGLYEISELLMMSKDIDTEILYGSGGKLGVSDYCTIYSDGKINLNVAPVHVLELLPGLNVGGLAKSLEEYRQENELENLRDLQKIPGASARTSTQLTNIAVFKSRYFNVKLECLKEDGGTVSYTVIIDRTAKKIVRWEEV